LGRAHAELAGLGAQAVGVGPGSVQAADRVQRLLKLPFPVLSDAKREVYRRFGFRRRAGLWQESGTVVVGPSGEIALAHRTANPQRALPFDEVRRALSAGVPGR
jgi:peroxiredoxin